MLGTFVTFASAASGLRSLYEGDDWRTIAFKTGEGAAAGVFGVGGCGARAEANRNRQGGELSMALVGAVESVGAGIIIEKAGF